MTVTFTHKYTETFHVVTCYTCDIPFGITEGLYRRVVKDAKGSIYCPACGSKTCWRESEEQRKIRHLQSQLASAERRADTAKRRADSESLKREKAENSLRTTKGVVTKIKNRVGRGICPCCNRQFENLQRHMKTKHPDYIEQ